jgi:hypothetical protein
MGPVIGFAFGFARRFPFDIVKPQSSDVTFYSRRRGWLNFLPGLIGWYKSPPNIRQDRPLP